MRPNRTKGFTLLDGFTLIELMITMAIIGILAGIAYPSYQNYVTRTSREAAKTEMLELAGVQERIYLNSNAYSPTVATAYNGQAAGGLGRTSGRTKDAKYDITLDINTPSQSFTLTATPVAGTTQANDGTITVNSSGVRTWKGSPW